MATLITGIVQLFGNLGLGAALVQIKRIDDEYLSTAFWSSLVVSAGLIFVSILAAPLASVFFNEPAIKWIIIFLSSNFIISSLSSIHRTLLYKDIEMKKIAIIEIFSRFIRVVVILAGAIAGLGFWSLVVGMIVECILKTASFIITYHWVYIFRPFWTLQRYLSLRFDMGLGHCFC
jgi:PST family polysaccharide transporter